MEGVIYFTAIIESIMKNISFFVEYFTHLTRKGLYENRCQGSVLGDGYSPIPGIFSSFVVSARTCRFI